MSIYIIAEAGVNHNGSFETACRLVDAAKEAGVDCIKFQTFRADSLVSKNAEKADYQKKNSGDTSQYDMLKQLELSYDEFRALKEYCDKKEIAFLSTPFEHDSIEFLGTIEMPFWKIPSGEITNYPYLVEIGKTKRPVVISTGMCEITEIEEAMNVLKQNGTPDIRLLQCNTEYPTPFEDVNLRAMHVMKEYFDVEVGYSDHTKGIEVAIAAAALGATIIEKHFTLDCNMEGPDHKASIEPDQLKQMVESIRHIEVAMGHGKKTPSPSEIKNRPIARKSIVASRPIKKGEILTEENITARRPGKGISPMKWNEVIGKAAVRDFDESEPIAF